MVYLYLNDLEYDENKQRIIVKFTNDLIFKKTEYIIKEKFYPKFYTKLPKELVKKLLSDFKKEINIKSKNQNTIVTAKDYETLKKCHTILSTSNNSTILLIEPKRQFLIKKDWSYYDLFYIISKNIKKIKDYKNLNTKIKEYLSYMELDDQKEIIQNLTKKHILSNLLKTKIKKEIDKDNIMNLLFENEFFKREITLLNKSKINFSKPEKIFENYYNIDFSNIWPHLLKSEFYNIGYKTLNCNCCKPKKIFSENTLSNSLIEVKFLKNGYYFLSKDKSFAYEFHKKNPKKENRLNYKKENKLKELPIGPFFNNQKEYIPLIDTIDNYDLEILQNHKLKWFCKKEESLISFIIKKIYNKLNQVEKSINLSNFLNYSKNFSSRLTDNPIFIQYITEYKLYNEILEEIPRFLEHKNTKFYDPEIATAIKYLKLETYKKIDKTDNSIKTKTKIVTKNKNMISKINSYFIKINLPTPKIIN